MILRNLPFLAAGLATTLAMAAVAALLGTLLAIAIALARYRRVPLISPCLAAYTALIQGTPLLIILLACFVAFPAATGLRLAATTACTAGFVLVLAAYCAEDIRAGLLAVPAATIEGAAALGLSPRQTLRLVTAPLAARIALPALMGQYVRMLKYTSVASAVGVTELTGSALLVNARIFRPLPLLGLTALAYFLLCLALSLAARALARHAALDTAAPARE